MEQETTEQTPDVAPDVAADVAADVATDVATDVAPDVASEPMTKDEALQAIDKIDRPRPAHGRLHQARGLAGAG